jgi:glucose-6-phosphate 1-dehydrogenase
MDAVRSDALVLFGATGDLAYKQIFPAVAAMIRRGHLDVPIIGVAKAGWSLPQLQARARESLEKHGPLDSATFTKLCAQLRYIDGDYRDPGTFMQLRKLLGDAQRPLHYLAIPPTLFASVAEGLAKSGCATNARVVLEKPFGRDLASAQELNRTLHQFFPEEAIFRIDHYLGKEPVQNLVYFRFANPLVEAAWDHNHVESMQITMAEQFGIKGRGKLYEELGAIRDVVQNHMLQVVACLAMECPKGKGHDALRNERGRLLQAVRQLNPSDVVRGQFRGYRNELDVAADSKVETFAAIRFHIDSDRWKNVPFFVRVGKCLPVTATEVLIRFKRRPRPIFDDPEPPLADYYRFQLSPKMVIALGATTKKAGERMEGRQVELVLNEQYPDEMEPYERLLGDASNGDPTLFARQDAVEAAWRVVNPILTNDTPLYEYEPGTWGPPEVDRQFVPEGGWHNPLGDENSD